MGILLGDGSMGKYSVRFTTDDEEIYEEINSEVCDGMVVNKIKCEKNNRTPSYIINIEDTEYSETRSKLKSGDRLHKYLKELDQLNLTESKKL